MRFDTCGRIARLNGGIVEHLLIIVCYAEVVSGFLAGNTAKAENARRLSRRIRIAREPL